MKSEKKIGMQKENKPERERRDWEERKSLKRNKKKREKKKKPGAEWIRLFCLSNEV